MPDIDALFPDKYDCFLALFHDSVYKHDKFFNYEFDESDSKRLKRRDRVDVINKIMQIAEYLFYLLQQKSPNLSRCEPFVDYSALLQSINRYSRDIYGFQRIKAKLYNLGDDLTEEQKNQIENIISESADFGYKYPTDAPYIE